MPLQPGARLGPYHIVESIGEGGMGQVYKARDTRLDRLAAIKQSATEFSDRFEREARDVAALREMALSPSSEVPGRTIATVTKAARLFSTMWTGPLTVPASCFLPMFPLASD
jgi:serine/threonine protein kinase